MSNGFYCGGLKAQMLPIAQGNALGNVRRDYTFGIFVPTAQKCHAPRARNTHTQCHGALPLIKQVALTGRDTLINTYALPRALPWAKGNIWAFSPPQPFALAAQASPVVPVAAITAHDPITTRNKFKLIYFI